MASYESKGWGSCAIKPNLKKSIEKKLTLLLPNRSILLLRESSDSDSKVTKQIDFYSLRYSQDRLPGWVSILNKGLFMSDYDPKDRLLYNLNPRISRMNDRYDSCHYISWSIRSGWAKCSTRKCSPSGNQKSPIGRSGLRITHNVRWILHGQNSNSSPHNEISWILFPLEFTNQWNGRISRSGRYFASLWNFLLDGVGFRISNTKILRNRTKRFIEIGCLQELDSTTLTSPEVNEREQELAKRN